MATARVARTATATTNKTTTPSSSSRTRRTVPPSAEDELVKKMNKVLKVADPTPQAGSSKRPAVTPSAKTTKLNDAGSSRRPASSSTSAATSTTKVVSTSTSTPAPTRVESTPTARKTVVPPNTARKTTAARSVPSTATTTRPVPPKTPSAPIAKPPIPSIDIDKLRATLPWAQAYSADAEKARGAMSCINSTIKNLGQAAAAGYKHSDASTVKLADGSSISPQQVDEWMTTCEIAVEILREVSLKGVLGSKALEVEKAAVNISIKAVALGMHHRALVQLIKGRPLLLGKYDHVPKENAIIHSQGMSTPGPSHTSPKTPAPKIASSSTVSTSISPEWLDLLTAPGLADPSQVEVTIKNLLCQSTICAWISVSALAGSSMNYTEQFPNPNSSPVTAQLHPLVLSLQTPQATAMYSLQLLYRQFSSVSIRDRIQWLHTRSLALSILATTISVDPPSKTTPQQLWEHTQKTFAGFVELSNSDTGSLRRVSDSLGALLEWVETIIVQREQARNTWMAGKAWQSLMDFWIALSRRLSDTHTIDRALGLMGNSSSLLPRTPPRKNLPPLQDEPPSPPSIAHTKGKEKQRRSRGLAEVNKSCGDLAKTNIVVDKYLESPDDLSSASAESGLKIVDLEDLSDAVMGITDHEDVPPTLVKVYRAVARIRRGCVRILERKDDPLPSSTLITAAQHWLGCSVDLTEDLLRSPHDITSIATDFVGSTIDSLLVLSRMPSASAQSALTQLDRGRKLCILARLCCNDADRADWMRCLSSSAYHTAGKHWHLGKFSDVLGLAHFSTDIGTECLGTVSPELRLEAKWKAFDDFMTKRWDLLAATQHKLGDRKRSLDAYFSGFGAVSLDRIEALSSDLKTQSIKVVFGKLPDLKSTLQRCAQGIVFDHESTTGRTEVLLAPLGNLPVDIKGAIAEQIIDNMMESSYRSEIAIIALSFGDFALNAYTVNTMPIRRARVLIRMISIISQSGQQSERVPDLARQADEATAMSSEDLSLDSGLERCRSETAALCLLQQALFAYYNPESSNQVVSLGRKAMEQLRQILIPSTKPMNPSPSTPPRRAVGASTRSSKKPSVKPIARPTKTPTRSTARAVSDSRTIKGSPRVSNENKTEPEPASETLFDDLDRVSALLGTLTSLFGMLGHVLAKIEALKLLRAILRHEETHLDEYVLRSTQLATEYLKLGKMARAKTVFAQVLKSMSDSKRLNSIHPRVEFHLRYTVFLAVTGQIDDAEAEYAQAETISQEVFTSKANSVWARSGERIELLSRISLAHLAMAAIHQARGNRVEMSKCLGTAFRLQSRVADVACRLAAEGPPDAADAKLEDDDPFVVKTGAEEPSKDAVQQKEKSQATIFKKHLYGLQWAAAENLLDVMLGYTAELLHRGSVKEGEHILKVASELSAIVKSPIMSARIQARVAEIQCRLQQYGKSLKTLDKAQCALVDLVAEQALGPDGVELVRIKGDLYAKQDMTAEAGEMFEQAMSDVQGLEAVFNTNEALIPSPKKMRASINNILAVMATSRSTPSRKKAKMAAVSVQQQSNDVVLPDAVKHVLRQQAWLFREAGFLEDSEEVLAQIKAFCPGDRSEAEDLYLDGRVGLHTAFSQFKTDLWMSSLTDTTLAMPMGNPQQRTRDRQSTRRSIQTVLQGAERAFIGALSSATGIGKVEDVRQACLSIALLRAFQTSLGEGSGVITTSAADILATATAITFPREIVEVIDRKFPGHENDDVRWPSIKGNSELGSPASKDLLKGQMPSSPTPSGVADPEELAGSTFNDNDKQLRDFWQSVRSKYAASTLLFGHDVSALPPDWIVISINVTEDRTTMFISRHQADHEPIVLTLPLDRQGKREDEAESDMFTYDAAIEVMKGIIDESNEGARTAKTIVDREGRVAWWDKRFELDRRLEELCQKIEFSWLGAFKTILNAETGLKAAHLEIFRNKIELVFNRALFGEKAQTQDSKKSGKVHLDDSLLRRFVELSSKCKDEEAEDLVYFILDIYQFYGVQVALAELDIDQLAVDIKTVLADLEVLRGEVKSSPDEHVFLALDKNVSAFPWESIPILRGRAVSRVPSLPFMLDQMRLSAILSPSASPDVSKRTLDTKKVFYILNSSGDLERTQTYFEPWLKEMTETCGWKGVIGRAPTELEMINALTNFDLVLYFGHGGAEQYIRSYKVRELPKCATTMLWGCSSGALRDQGDFDRTGTAYNYLQGGCPSLVANLWDVTDKDIDRLSEDVLKRLHLDPAHVPHVEMSKSASSRSTHANGTQGGMSGLTTKMGRINLVDGISSVKAVALAREECKLKYLTGAAPVVYGLPMYLH